ncbi:hypothetical protein CL647_00060, partial [bacterium]|nr:hypothetical protein [bacterium]
MDISRKAPPAPAPETALRPRSGAAPTEDRESNKEQEATEARAAAELILPELPDDMSRYFLGYLTPSQLANCMQVSSLYNKLIKETPSLNQSVQHAKYLILAKQTADLIQFDYMKSKAYCAIATVQAKSNPEEANQTLRLAKQTAEHIQDDNLKSN